MISPEQQINETLTLLKDTLGDDLLALYLYGSSLLGGREVYSDIDLFAVINHKTTRKEKTKLVKGLLNISGIHTKLEKPPIEITIVEKSEMHPWRYPPRFDFQYGEWLRPSFEQGIIEPPSEMSDLAVIITQVRLLSKTLLGKDPENTLPVVPYKDFMRALIHDLDRLKTELQSDTRNVLLTYARIWSTLETNEIKSKPNAAEWAILQLPDALRPVMERAMSISSGKEIDYWEDLSKPVEAAAELMIEHIKARYCQLNFDDPMSKIVIAKENISVRDYQETDVEALKNIFYHTIHTINAKDYTKEQLDVWAPKAILNEDRWGTRFQRTKPFVATVGQKVVGFAEFETNGHIDCFYCHHEWIGKGVGSALLKAIETRSKSCKVDRIFAEVSITAKPFFERNGFVVVREQKVEKLGVLLTNFVMEKIY